MIQMINDGRIKVELNVEKQNRHSLNNKLYLESKKFALKTMRNYLATLYFLIMS